LDRRLGLVLGYLRLFGNAMDRQSLLGGLQHGLDAFDRGWHHSTSVASPSDPCFSIAGVTLMVISLPITSYSFLICSPVGRALTRKVYWMLPPSMSVQRNESTSTVSSSISDTPPMPKPITTSAPLSETSSGKRSISVPKRRVVSPGSTPSSCPSDSS